MWKLQLLLFSIISVFFRIFSVFFRIFQVLFPYYFLWFPYYFANISVLVSYYFLIISELFFLYLSITSLDKLFVWWSPSSGDRSARLSSNPTGGSSSSRMPCASAMAVRMRKYSKQPDCAGGVLRVFERRGALDIWWKVAYLYMI